jgi:uncharacterized membrane protein
MFRRLFQFFLTGLTTLLPISITVFILYSTFRFIDNLFAWLIERIFGFSIIGLGFLLTISTITLVGLFAKNYLAVQILAYIEKITLKIPIIQVIYSGIKELSNLFTTKGVKNFSEVVTVQFPNEHCTSIGFVTKDGININDENKVSVFIPTTPNPGNGFLIFVEKDQLTYLDIKIEDAIKSIVSMGSITPENITQKKSQ